MAVRVNWHEDAVVESSPGSSPFDLASSVSVSGGLSLDMSAEQLRETITRLVKREAKLSDSYGLSCPIKDRCDTSCIACPLNEANNPDSRKGLLCKVGVEQEQADTLFAVKTVEVSPEEAAPAPKW